MSKAFTRETDDSSEELDGELDAEDSAESGIPKGARNYITPEGARHLKEELHDLLSVQRPEVVRTVSWAASNGDRSENGDYIYGKRRLREIDRRIRFLTKRLEAAEVIDPRAQKDRQRVLFGASVTVRDEEQRTRSFRIVGIDESDPRAGKVSWISPVAKALLNQKVGDAVMLQTPKGEEELVIVAIGYE